jgi:hypothetical protein
MAGVRRSNTKKKAERILTFTQGDQESLIQAQEAIANSELTYRADDASLGDVSTIGVNEPYFTTYTECDSAAHIAELENQRLIANNPTLSLQRDYTDCDSDVFYSDVIISLLNLALNVSPHRESGSRDKWQTSYAFILEWDINEDILAYASRVRGYKSGGYDVRSNNSTNSSLVTNRSGNYISGTENPPGGFNPGTFEFNDEESLAHEIGIKASIGDAAEINASYFYNEIKDLQVSVFDGGVGFNVSNAASAKVEGFEVDGRLAISENLMLTGSLAWLDFEFQEYTNGVCTADDRIALNNGLNGIDYIESVEPGSDGLTGNYLDNPNEFDSFDLNGDGAIEVFDFSLGFPLQRGPEGIAIQAAQQDNITRSTLIDGNCESSLTGFIGNPVYNADMSGMTNQYVSSYSGALSLMYENEVSSDLVFRAAFDMNFTGSYHPTQNLDESVKQEGHEVYNVRFSLSSLDGRYDISLIGRNILDQKIISYANDVPLATSQFGTVTKFGFLQRPKSWGIQARYNFF